MSKIPLRTYNREIEGMIDRGQAAQAVDHCHHILKYFPKHIDTYRLLGKAFLELQRYTEAADVLQRVLACVPDDFISQIGMGIIREDEGDLDSAIWHMERAFEIQPSNVGVQNELRRLYGRRDGVQPAKIRLTRGALVRMYSRGELYQQAIGEIRAALMEDPQRIDLEVILARMYFLSGQKVAATEVCTRLIGKLPFCFEVNRILAEILPGSARAEDAKHYLQRIHALDPYLAHLSDKVLSTAEVPETAVEVDRLEWIPDQQPASLPDWTKAIGAEWSDDTDKLPDWITEVQEESSPEQIQPVQQTPSFDPKDAAESSTPEKEDEQPIFEEEDKEEIPDWMKQAGWEPATEESAQQPSAEGLFEDSETQEEAEQAELPDWLAAMAPAETEPEPEDEDTEKSEWLESILPPEKSEDEVDEPTETEDLDETESEIEPELVSRKEEEQLPEPMVDSASTPIEEEAKEQIDFREDEGALPGEESWVSEESLAELAGAATEEKAPEEESIVSEEPLLEKDTQAIEKDISLEDEANLEEESVLEIEEDAASSELTTEEAEESPVEEEEQIPEWLANLQSPETGTPADEIDRGLDWMKDISPEPQAEISNLEEGQLPDWLTAKETEGVSDSIEEDQGEETEMPHLYEAPDEIEDTQPTKIKRDESTKPEIDIQNDKPLESDQEFPMPWMDSFDDKTDESDTAQFTSPEEPGEEMPDWIQDIIAEEDVPEFREKPEQTMAPTSAETPAQIVDSANELEELLGKIAEGMPPEPEPIVGENREEIDFLKGVGELQEEGEDASSDQPDHSFGMKDSDEAFAWLEALAAKQGADEETLMAPPEHRVEEPPEWIKAEVEDSGVVGMELEVEPEGEIQEPEVTEELHELDAESKAELEELEVKPEHDLQEPEAKPVEEFQELEAKAVEEIEETDKIIDKQKIETQPEDIVEEPEIGETDQAIPEWLQNISADEEEPKEEIEFAIGSEEDKSDEGMDWLKRIAGDEEEPVTKTEEPGEIVEPESTQIPGAFKEEEAILHEAMPAESEELPDWLKGIDEEKPDKEPLQEFQPEETSAIPEPQEQQPEWIPEMVMEEEEESIPSEEEIAIESLTGPEFETTELAMVLKRAQEALEAYNIERALENYQQLIQSGQYLEETIHDLRDALYRYPIDVSIWQLLGDAYMKSNHLQDALDAYTKAEELLR